MRSSAEATSVERRPVKPEEVQPSRKFLAVDRWDQNLLAPAAKAIPDHETVMELSDDPAHPDKSIRTTRRHGPWEFQEEKVDHFRRRLTIMHDSLRIYLRYSHDEFRPHEQLKLARYDPTPTEAPAQPSVQAQSMQPKDLNRSETVVGETCRWFDMMPGMMDFEPACLSDQRRHHAKREAIQQRRPAKLDRDPPDAGPIGIDEIKPPRPARSTAMGYRLAY